MHVEFHPRLSAAPGPMEAAALEMPLAEEVSQFKDEVGCRVASAGSHLQASVPSRGILTPV